MGDADGANSGPAGHWDDVYRRHDVDELSWFRSEPTLSLELIGHWAPDTDAAVIDVGGGASTLVDRLVGGGYRDLTVLDVSAEALSVSQERLAAMVRTDPQSADPGIQWIHADLLAWAPPRRYDLWHDRAVFHFLTERPQQLTYREVLRSAIAPGGHAVLATFAEDGPQRCSGLPTARYSPTELATAMAPHFELADQRREEHVTPAGIVQPFTWVVLRAD